MKTANKKDIGFYFVEIYDHVHDLFDYTLYEKQIDNEAFFNVGIRIAFCPVARFSMKIDLWF